MAVITLPTPGVTPGPLWATQLNTAVSAVNADVMTRALSQYPGGYKIDQYYMPDAPGVGTSVLTQSRAYAVPFVFVEATSVTRIAVEVTAAVAATTLRLGIYTRNVDAADDVPLTLVADLGTVSAATTGVKTLGDGSGILATITTPEIYFLVCVAQGGAPTVRTQTGPCPPVAPLAFPGTTPSTAYYKDGITGALPPSWYTTAWTTRTSAAFAPMIAMTLL